MGCPISFTVVVCRTWFLISYNLRSNGRKCSISDFVLKRVLWLLTGMKDLASLKRTTFLNFIAQEPKRGVTNGYVVLFGTQCYYAYPINYT